MPLASLRVFVVTAEQLSFTRAASVLGVTAGAVSMQIKALEDYLGTPLLRRHGRKVELTSEGRQLLPRVRAALDALEQAIDEVRAERRSGPVMLSTLASFLQQWLLPRLPDFHEQHSKIDLRLHTSPELVDFLHSGVHAAVRYGLGNWPQFHVEKLLEEWLAPVCAPALLAKHGPVATRTDLKRYRLLHSTSEPWRAWHQGTTTGEEWAPAGSTFDDSVSVIRAAEAGQGLALGRWSLASHEIAAGRLSLASSKIVLTQRAYYFVCPPAYLQWEKVAKLREWLQRQAAAAPKPAVGRR